MPGNPNMQGNLPLVAQLAPTDRVLVYTSAGTREILFSDLLAALLAL